LGLKAGWLALFIFVWIIGAFLGSTFEYQDTAAASGMAYSTGTANFTTNNATVMGAGTTWNNALMAGGLIKCNADDVWYKILSVNSTSNLTLASVYAQAGGIGQAYTMQASPGWAGSGTGGYATSPTSKLEDLLNVSNAVQRIELLGAIPFPVPNGNYFNTAYEVVTWQWSFLDGYGMFYWIFLAPFVVMGVLSMILLVYGILTGNLSF
jgi:hypothetical protein